MNLDFGAIMAKLVTYHHFALKTENRGERRSYSCTIWNGGRRVSAYGPTPGGAATRAIGKIDSANKPKLKLTGA